MLIQYKHGKRPDYIKRGYDKNKSQDEKNSPFFRFHDFVQNLLLLKTILHPEFRTGNISNFLLNDGHIRPFGQADFNAGNFIGIIEHTAGKTQGNQHIFIVEILLHRKNGRWPDKIIVKGFLGQARNTSFPFRDKYRDDVIGRIHINIQVISYAVTGNSKIQAIFLQHHLTGNQQRIYWAFQLVQRINAFNGSEVLLLVVMEQGVFLNNFCVADYARKFPHFTGIHITFVEGFPLHGGNFNIGVKHRKQRNYYRLETIENAQHNDKRRCSNGNSHHRNTRYQVDDVVRFLRNQVPARYEKREIQRAVV